MDERFKILRFNLFTTVMMLAVLAMADDVKAQTQSQERLSDEQQRIADKYKHLEEILLRMAELTASTDPQRSELLRATVAQSKQRLIGVQFELLVEQLGEERLSRAIEGQTDLERDLVELLKLLLSEDRAKRIASEKARFRRYLKQLNRIIRKQKALKSQSEAGGDGKQLAQDQGWLAEKTGRLGGQMKSDEEMGQPGSTEASGEKDGENSQGKPSAEKSQGQSGGQGEGSGGEQSGEQSAEQSQEPPSEADNPARGRLEAARKKMKEAQESLQKAQRGGAVEKQEEALRHLQQAKAELEKILRQLRQEEMKRMLRTLHARFAKMLKLQRQVYKGTILLHKVPKEQRSHAHEIGAGRLAGKQSKIVLEADKAFWLLKEDGTAVAFPEAVAQMRDDMQEVADRLGRNRVGQITQGLEEDILAALEEMIDALEKEIEKLEEQNAQDSQLGGRQQDPPLVDALAELKMIRALQMRVNRRTARYAKLLEGEEARNTELQEALRRLAQRQARIHEVTRKLDLEKDK